MAAFGSNYGGYGYPNTSGNFGWTTVQTTATTWPIYIQPQTDWERAAVKAEPDDEFTWLRKRVREMEEMAFA